MLQDPSSLKHFSSVCIILGQSYGEAFQGACFKIFFVPSLMSTAQVADPEQPPLRLAASTTHTCRTLMSGSKSQLCFLAQGLSSWFFTSVLKLFFSQVCWKMTMFSKATPLTRPLKPKGKTGESHARILFAHQDCSFAAHQRCPNSPWDHILHSTSCRRFDAVKVHAWGWRACRKYPRNVAQRQLRSCSSLAWYERVKHLAEAVATHYFKPDLIIWINLWTLRRALLKAKFLGTWSVCGSCANLEPISNKCTDRSSEEWRRLCRDRVQTWTRVHLYVRILFKVITWVNHSGMNNASELGGVGRGWSATDLTVLPYFLAWNITTFLLWCIWGWESKQILGCNPSCGCLGWNPSDQRTICWWNTSCMTSRESDAVIEFIDLE